MLLERHHIEEFLGTSPKAVLVTIDRVKGSVPRRAGTWMLVSGQEIFRTIGGGQLEYLAINAARAMLRDGTNSQTMNVPLGPEIGQCCGGRVWLKLERLTERQSKTLARRFEAEIAGLTDVYIFGAGHVGRALAACLQLLPVRPVLVDTRENELQAAPNGVETCLAALPEAVVRDANPGSVFVILTHDHALDFLITKEALERRDAAYVGLIGSRSKRATFLHWLKRESDMPKPGDTLICPIGSAGAGDNRPEVIASFTAAEIMAALAHARALHQQNPSPRLVPETVTNV